MNQNDGKAKSAEQPGTKQRQKRTAPEQRVTPASPTRSPLPPPKVVQAELGVQAGAGRLPDMQGGMSSTKAERELRS